MENIEYDEPEIWKDIPGYEGLYQCSNYGKIKSLDRVLIVRTTNNKRRLKGKILKIFKVSGKENRYLVRLKKDYIGKSYYVHQLIALTFIGPCPEGLEICHNDGNGYNNYYKNLRYDTHKNNCIDTVKHCKTTKGTKQPNHKLTEKQVLKIKYLGSNRIYTYRKLAKIYKISSGHISNIVNNKNSWVWLK